MSDVDPAGESVPEPKRRPGRPRKVREAVPVAASLTWREWQAFFYQAISEKCERDGIPRTSREFKKISMGAHAAVQGMAHYWTKFRNGR